MMKGKGDVPNSAERADLTGDALKRAYDNALRVVDRDAEILDQLRSRASILLAALAIGGTVLGGVLSNRRPPIWLFGLLGLPIVFCIFVLWSTRDHGRLTIPGPKQRRPRQRWLRTFSAAVRRLERRRITSWAGSYPGAAIEKANNAGRAITMASGYAHALFDGAAEAREHADAAAVALARAEVRAIIMTNGAWLDAGLAEAREAIRQVRDGAQILLDRAAKIREQADAAVATLELVRAAVQATDEVDAAGLDAVIARAKVRAEQPIGQARVGAQAFLDNATRVREQANAAVAALGLVRAAVLDADKADPAQPNAEKTNVTEVIGRTCNDAQALLQHAAGICGHAEAAAGELKGPRWQLLKQLVAKLLGRVGHGGQYFMAPWKEWFWALVEGDQRLWKIGLGKDDLLSAQRHAEQNPGRAGHDSVDQFLLGLLYTAHTRNDGTINRRADLLRFASVLALVFVIALGIWLSSTS